MITSKNWLTLHRLCVDTVRCAIEGLSDQHVVATPLQGDMPIGEHLCHVIGAERYWLGGVGIGPEFAEPPTAAWSESAFLAALDAIEAQYERILSARVDDPDVLFGLGRTSQHALYHGVRIAALRRALEPGWEPARGLSWERAADYLTQLLIVGEAAEVPEYAA